MGDPAFGDEFQRLVRALIDSSERESELQRQLRRTKESLVAVALRLQVAIKVTQEDEYTISILQRDIAEARSNAIISSRQASVAAETIASLNLEISSLKRRLRAIEKERISQAPNPNFLADSEVDAFMAQDLLRMTIPPDIGGKPALATPFERWKIEKFLFSPDTPAASESQDKYVVDALSEIPMISSADITRPTKISVAKTAQKRYSDSKNMSMASSPSGKDHSSGGNDQYFLDPKFPFWGDGVKTDRDNLARVNLWTTLSHSRVAEELITSPTGQSKSPGKLRFQEEKLRPISAKGKLPSDEGRKDSIRI
eukprot:gene22868-31169_t